MPSGNSVAISSGPSGAKRRRAQEDYERILEEEHR